MKVIINFDTETAIWRDLVGAGNRANPEVAAKLIEKKVIPEILAGKVQDIWWDSTGGKSVEVMSFEILQGRAESIPEILADFKVVETKPAPAPKQSFWDKWGTAIVTIAVMWGGILILNAIIG